MSQIPPRLSEFASRLLRREAETGGAADDAGEALERVCRALHERLAPLISSAGYQTLIARSLTLASRDFPFLSGVSVTLSTPCAFSGLPRLWSERDPAEATDAVAAVLAHFIWLLVLFIGENLGLRTVREVWPEVPLDATDALAGPTR